MLIDLLCHGETTAGQCFIGNENVLLTEKGWQQMRAAVAEQQYDHVVSSPMLRCLDFAQQFAADAAIQCSMEPDFSDYDYGEWQGKAPAEIEKTQRALLSSFRTDPYLHPAPGGEDFNRFQHRTGNAINKQLQLYAGKKLLVVTHANVIRMIMVSLLNKSWQQASRTSVAQGECIRLCMTDNGLKMQDDCYLCDYM